MVDYEKLDYYIIGFVSGFVMHQILIFLLGKFGFF